LQQQPVVGVEKKYTERTVQIALGLGGQELVALIFVAVAHDLVPLIHNKAFVLQHKVLLRPSTRPGCHAVQGLQGRSLGCRVSTLKKGQKALGCPQQQARPHPGHESASINSSTTLSLFWIT
jgi:hypothetical protein